jgi:N4-gp56 family major capsid protein
VANEITSSTTSSDQEKFLAAKLLKRSSLRLVSMSLCDKLDQPNGTGTTANFVRYKRMFVPLAELTEGTTPSNSTFTIETQTVTLDQWGDVLTLTDVTQLTTKHPVLNQAMELLADNAQRVLDREVQIVFFAGTNVMYGNGVVTTRATITTSHVANDTIINKARVALMDDGVPTRDGPAGEDAKATEASGTIRHGKAYVGVAGPQVMADIMAQASSVGQWASVAQYNAAEKQYNAEVGTWLGIRWVETNFIPKINILGGTTTAVASGNAFGTNTPVVTAVDGGGSLTSATTYYYKVTRKDKLRGFEEDISIEHTTASTATGNNESFTFNFSSLTAGYVYNLYFGSATGDSNLKLHTENIAVGDTVTVTSVPSSTTTAPANVNTTGTPTIHPVYILGAEACNWVGLQDLKVLLSKTGASTDDPLDQRRTVGYKFMGKAMIRDQDRLLRLELASNF